MSSSGSNYVPRSRYPIRLHKCNICSHISRKLWDIKRHILRVHVKYGVVGELTSDCYTVIESSSSADGKSSISESTTQKQETIAEKLIEILAETDSDITVKELPNVTVRELLNVPAYKRLRRCPLCPYTTPSKSHFDRHMNSSVHAKENQRKGQIFSPPSSSVNEDVCTPSNNFGASGSSTLPTSSSFIINGTNLVNTVPIPIAENSSLLDDLEPTYPMSTNDLLLQMVGGTADSSALAEGFPQNNTPASSSKISAKIPENCEPSKATKQVSANINSCSSEPTTLVEAGFEGIGTESGDSRFTGSGKSSTVSDSATHPKSALNGLNSPNTSSGLSPSPAECDVIVLSDSESEEEDEEVPIKTETDDYEVGSNDSDDGYMRCTECSFMTDKSFTLIKHMVETHQGNNTTADSEHSKNDSKEAVLA